MRRSGRVTACALALAILLGLGTIPHPQPTDATFTDTEAASASLSAGTVQPPVRIGTPGCTAGGVLGILPTVTITWQVPAQSGYTVDNVEFGQLNTQGLLVPIVDLELLNSVTTTGTPTSYSTRIGGLMLQNLLGGQKVIGMRIHGPGAWTSSWLVATATWGALGIGNTCTMSIVPSA
jgi:hypothetical protein